MAVLFFLIGLWFIVGFYLGAQWQKRHARQKALYIMRLFKEHHVKDPQNNASIAFNEALDTAIAIIGTTFAE